LILGKIIKIVATRCQILTLKCTKIDFGWGSAPDPAGGAYSAPPGPIAGFKGPSSKGREGKGTGGEWRRAGARPVCLLVLTILATGLYTCSSDNSEYTVRRAVRRAQMPDNEKLTSNTVVVSGARMEAADPAETSPTRGWDVGHCTKFGTSTSSE